MQTGTVERKRYNGDIQDVTDPRCFKVADHCVIQGIQPDQIDEEWHEIGPILQRAIDRSRGRSNNDDVLKALRNAEMQLWVARDEFELLGVWVTRLVKYPDTKVCEILFASGAAIQKWCDPGLNVIEEWARSCGCERVEIIGRQGWQRMTRHRGYRPIWTTLEKLL